MASGTFVDFATRARAEGYDEVLERSWPADARLDTHTHPFALKARVVSGEMWLSVGAQTLHLQAGDDFALDREIPHAERYGAQGATYWVARRN
jgi:hypothetical protein